MSDGPLTGVRVLEFGGIGPGPFCGMLLCDLGAEVVRIDRAGFAPPYEQFAHRGRLSVALDLKKPASVEACLQLAAQSDLLFEGFRPGVMERLGLGPDVALARNRKLVYGRMTGWGQEGPYAQAAGHDINYISLSGALHAIGLKERPAVPLNLIGDFGGGALYLAFGMLAALTHARETGHGQVVDVAMTDGVASLMTTIFGRLKAGQWRDGREANLLDGGAPFYGCRSARWSRNSTRCCARRLARPSRCSMRSTIVRFGPPSASAWKKSLQRARAMNGRLCSAAAMCALRQCSISTRRIATNTMPRARPSLMSVAR
jgi:alpha-methylacyl-CoA racemase